VKHGIFISPGLATLYGLPSRRLGRSSSGSHDVRGTPLLFLRTRVVPASFGLQNVPTLRAS
jgi:hypothetical protein